MKTLKIALPIALMATLLGGCFQTEKAATAPVGEIEGGPKVPGPELNNSDPYKSNYTGPLVDKKEPYVPGSSIPAASRDSNGVSLTPTGLKQSAIPGSWVGVIPLDFNFCPEWDRVTVRMDDQDNNNLSYLSSLDPVPAGVYDNNPTNTTMTFCKLDGNNFRRLKTVNYAVINLGDVCVNGGIKYEQTIDNEDSHNANSWSGCCGGNNPNWWSTGGIYSGYVKLQICYYPKDPAAPVELTFPNMISRNYAVFTEKDQSNKYLISYGEVYSDDEDVNNKNNQVLVGSANVTTFNAGILDWRRSDPKDSNKQGWTLWRFGKILKYVP